MSKPGQRTVKPAASPAAKARASAKAGTSGKASSKAGAKSSSIAKPKPKPPAAARHKVHARSRRTGDRGVVRLAGGNPQIAKGDGDAPVQAYIAAMPDWKRDVGERLDALVARTVPGVRKAVKWNSPFYGVEGQGWFLSFHVFTRYVKVTFFKGATLRPPPPGGSKHPEVRYLDIHEGELDEKQLASWVKQAAAIPGWMA